MSRIKKKTMETESTVVVLGRGEIGRDSLIDMGFSLGMMKIF